MHTKEKRLLINVAHQWYAIDTTLGRELFRLKILFDMNRTCRANHYSVNAMITRANSFRILALCRLSPFSFATFHLSSVVPVICRLTSFVTCHLPPAVCDPCHLPPVIFVICHLLSLSFATYHPSHLSSMSSATCRPSSLSFATYHPCHLTPVILFICHLSSAVAPTPWSCDRFGECPMNTDNSWCFFQQSISFEGTTEPGVTNVSETASYFLCTD